MSVTSKQGAILCILVSLIFALPPSVFKQIILVSVALNMKQICYSPPINSIQEEKVGCVFFNNTYSVHTHTHTKPTLLVNATFLYVGLAHTLIFGTS